MNKSPKISLISAIDRDFRTIGLDDSVVGQRQRGKSTLPWHIPNDFKNFKETTMDHPIIMGRTTWEEFKKPLPGRVHIVVTRDQNYQVSKGHFVANSIESAIEKAKTLDKDEVFIIGGAQIYKQSLEYADRLYLTLVKANLDGNVKFPEYKNEFKKVIERREIPDEKYECELVILERD